MFDTFLGLPLHVLVVHAAVAGIPVATVLTAAVAVRRPWRERLIWPVAVFDLVMLGVTYLARESGEAFLRRIGESSAVTEHREIAGSLPYYVLALCATSLFLALFCRRWRGPLGGLVSLVAVAVAAATLVQTAHAGHSGSQAAWGDIVRSTSGR